MATISETCPVCAMPTVMEVPPVEYHGMHFRFCSDQCRQMFLAQPALYSAKLGQQRAEVIKRRTLRLAEPAEEEVAALLTSYLQELMGVKDVAIEGRDISISYDLTQVTEKQIEAKLVLAGIELDGSWWQRVRRCWAQYREKNELNNLAANPAACCNRPPPRA